MRLLRHGRTAQTGDQCEYASCGQPGAGEARYHELHARNGIPWTMCREHLKPEHHPRDARGKLVTW